MATVAALVAAAAPAVAVIANDGSTYVDYFGGDNSSAKTPEQANKEAGAKFAAEDAAKAAKEAEEAAKKQKRTHSIKLTKLAQLVFG